MLYKDEAVVLRTMRLGEADRIVTFVGRGQGKIRAVAKGVRKTTSKFGARLEPTSRIALQCYKGRELDIVTQAEALDHFRVIREDLDRLARATTMLEAVDQVAQDPAPSVLALPIESAPAVSASSTRRDARHQYLVALGDGADRSPGLDHRSHCLVAEGPPWCHAGHIAL